MADERTTFYVYDRTFPGLTWKRDKSLPIKIYVLVDPQDSTVRYVGSTHNVLNRFGQHITLQSLSNEAIAEWKLGLRRVGLRPLMAVVDSAAPEHRHVAEMEWIHYYLRRGRLTNAAIMRKVTFERYWRHRLEWRSRDPSYARALQEQGPEALEIRRRAAQRRHVAARGREIDRWLAAK
jgi:hypothetical protein